MSLSMGATGTPVSLISGGISFGFQSLEWVLLHLFTFLQR